MDAQERIKQQVTGNPVVLYMKGTPQFPQCGFSANAVQILKACGVEQVFTVTCCLMRSCASMLSPQIPDKNRRELYRSP